MRLVLVLIIAAAFLALVAGVFSIGRAHRAQAGSLVVTTTADSGDGSLRQALADAGASPGADTITFDPAAFPPGNPATIVTTDGFSVEGDAASQPLTIDGTGAGVIIQGQQATDTEALFDFRRSGTISGITLRNFTLRGSVALSDNGGEGLEFSATDLSDILIEHLSVINNDGNGVQIKASGAISNVTVLSSEINENGYHGLFIGAAALDDVTVTGNEASQNDAVGIDLKADTSPSPSTVMVNENVATMNTRDGIAILSESANPTTHITISRNETSANGGLGINLGAAGDPQSGVTQNDPGDGDTGANALLNFPLLQTVTPEEVAGTACSGCLVELFLADPGEPTNHGEGATFLDAGSGSLAVTGSGTDGAFSVPICGSGIQEGAELTATATDQQGNTSEFSLNLTVTADAAAACSSTPTPTPTPTASPTGTGPQLTQGDVDCDGNVSSVDALKELRDIVQLAYTQNEPCPDIGDNAASIWGDVDCTGSVTSVDALKILRHVAQLTVSQNDPCPDIGSPEG